MASGFNKFLETGVGSIAGLQDGTEFINASTLTAANLDASLPCKTDVSRIIQTTLLDIADTNGLQTALDNALSSPLTANLDAGDFEINNLDKLIVNTDFGEGSTDVANLVFTTNTGDVTIDMADLDNVILPSTTISTNALAVWNDGTGKLLRGAIAIKASANNLTGINGLTATTLTTSNNLLIDTADASNITKYGFEAGLNSTSSQSVLLGEKSGIDTTGSRNVFIGHQAQGVAIGGTHNVGTGFSVLSVNTGSDNVGVGSGALGSVTSGDRNIGIGRGAGDNLVAGNDNICIEANGASGDSDTIRIGSSHNRNFTAGIRGITPTIFTDIHTLVIDSSNQMGSEEYSPSSTGIINGTLMTINAGDSDLLDISAGKMHVYNPTTSVASIVSYGAQIGLVTGAVGLETFVSLNSSGVAIFSTTLPSNALIRDQAFLGRIVSFSPPTIFSIDQEQVAINNPANMIRDLSSAIGFINVQGSVMSSNNLLTLARTSGKTYAHGFGYKSDPKDPNIANTVSMDTNGTPGFPNQIFRFFQSGANLPAETSVIPDEYDDGNGSGSPGSVGMNNWQVIRLFLFPATSGLAIQVGMFTYGTKSDAVDAINVELFIINPALTANGLLVGFLAVKGSATDLSVFNDAEFFTSGKFGGISASGSGGDVFGPSSSVSQRIATFSGTTGKLIQDSGITIDGGPSIAGVAGITNTTSDPFIVTNNPTVTVNAIPVYDLASGASVIGTGITIDGSDNLANANSIDATSISTPSMSIQEIGGGGQELTMTCAVLTSPYSIIFPSNTELPSTNETHYLTIRDSKLAWDDNDEAPLPKGYINEGLVAWNSVSQISFNAIVCRSNTNTKNLQRTNTTLNMGTSGLLGIQTGSSEASNTWYELLVIGDLSEANADSAIFLPVSTGFSQSGYDLFRRIASVRNNASSNLLKFTNPDSLGRNRIIFYDEDESVLKLLNNGTASSFTTLSLATLVPPTSRQVYLNVSYDSESGDDFVELRNADSTISASAIRVITGRAGGHSGNNQFLMNCNGSQEIQYKNNQASNAFTDIWVLGYIDKIF